MNNDINRNRQDNKPQENVQRQDFAQRGFQFPPGRPGMDNQPRGPLPNIPPQAPGMEGQPRSAPPGFTPEMPGMERGPMTSPGQFNYGPRDGYRDGDRDRDRDRDRGRDRDMRRCLNRFTFIWLVNGNSFWFYPTFVDRQFVMGFRWRRNRWEYDRINLRRILFHRCY